MYIYIYIFAIDLYIYIYTRYIYILQIPKIFKYFLYKSKGKPNKLLLIDKGNEFYERLMKSWLQDNIIEVSSIHIKGKSVFD